MLDKAAIEAQPFLTVGGLRNHIPAHFCFFTWMAGLRPSHPPGSTPTGEPKIVLSELFMAIAARCRGTLTRHCWMQLGQARLADKKS